VGNPNAILNTPGDVQLMEEIFKAASQFKTRIRVDIMKSDLQKEGITPLFTCDEI
jgi:hypothetical protein